MSNTQNNTDTFSWKRGKEKSRKLKKNIPCKPALVNGGIGAVHIFVRLHTHFFYATFGAVFMRWVIYAFFFYFSSSGFGV